MMRMRLRILLVMSLGLLMDMKACLADENHRPDSIHGLKVEYFRDSVFQTREQERVDPNIDCFWGEAAPLPSMPIDHFSIRWAGWIRAPKTGRYKLLTRCDDGIRLRINGTLVIDQHRAGNDLDEATVELGEQPVPISVEYFEDRGPAFCSLLWQSLSSPTYYPIPPEAFFPSESLIDPKAAWRSDDKQGLLAEFFDRDYGRRLGVGRISRVETIYHLGAPQPGQSDDPTVLYTGYLIPPVTGDYKFQARADDRLRMWIDGQPILEASHNRASSLTQLRLEANHPSSIKIEFADLPGEGGGFFSVHWIRPYEQTLSSIPSEFLIQTRSAISGKSP